MEANFFADGKPVRHPLEEKLGASGWAILTSIERSRMAVMNVKGQLAEYYLDQRMQQLLASNAIKEYEWRLDSPDFSVVWEEKPVRIECKNVRISDKKKDGQPCWWAEIQRTRDSKAGKGTRAYRVTDFDVLAVCLFNRTGKWEYRFIASKYLKVRASDTTLLDITQFVPEPAVAPWTDDLTQALRDAVT